MNSRAMYLFSAAVGPILVVAGLAGMLGFGIPAPYWLPAVLVGAAMILFGQRGLKVTRPVSADEPAEMAVLAQKRHRFWIFVAIASSLYAVGAFWVPASTPELREHLIVLIMLVTFGLCVGIFLYSVFTKQKP